MEHNSSSYIIVKDKRYVELYAVYCRISTFTVDTSINVDDNTYIHSRFLNKGL